MIRPSALQIAEHCGLAPELAKQYPEGSVHAERGTNLHDEIADVIRGKRRPESPEVKALAKAWGGLTRGVPEREVTVVDPETGDTITQGTADWSLVEADKVTVIDWKSGQEVTEPDGNLQILAYGLGLAMENDRPSFQVALCYLRPSAPDFRWSRIYTENDYWPLLDRIRKAASRKPEAVVGPHCDGCWQRKHCPAWLLPAHEGPSALEPFTRPAGLTAENAPRALQVVQAMKKAIEVAEAQIKDFARESPISDGNGKVWGPSSRAGRRTADVDALEAAGLHQYVREGKPYEVFGWRKR